MRKKILIIDDDTKLNSLLKTFLSSYDFIVRTATHPEEGLNIINNDAPQIIILDVMLPDMDGFEVCRRIRKNSDIPIIMLTARGDVTDRIVGLELGADDYLAKPFEPRELLARIQSVLRRSEQGPVSESKKLVIKDLVIDPDSRCARINGTDTGLTTMEFDVLSLLAHNPGMVFDRDRIIEKLRGYDWDSFDRSIDVLISRVRSKLKDDPKNPLYIKTIWGRGYMFIGRSGND